jgi:hypothetical protein
MGVTRQRLAVAQHLQALGVAWVKYPASTIPRTGRR